MECLPNVPLPFVNQGGDRPGDRETVKSALGDRIKRRRQELGLTQEEVAELAEVDRKHISSIETGKTDPGAWTLIRIAGALKIEVHCLLDGLIWVPNERGAGSGHLEHRDI
jgi:transcriptional regulator with XRE-family HTH domain